MIVPPPRPGPAPRQAIPSNIRAIHFPTVGGLVFFRARQTWLGSTPPPNGVAAVSRLPNGWAPFDMFSIVRQRDPTVTGTEPGVFDPVTDKMLSNYRLWPHDAPLHLTTTVPGPPSPTVIIIDTANWNLVYAAHITSRVSRVMSREAALAEFKGLVGTTGYEDLDPNLMGVGIFTNDFRDIVVPSAEFYAIAASGGWSYHEETGAPVPPSYLGDHTVTWILNLTKLYKDAPKVNNKKPTTYTFRVDMVTKDPKGAVTWTLQASADVSKVSTPPKAGDGRRTFPVHDLGSGDTAQHLVPTWTPWPDPAANLTVNEPAAGSYVDVKVTFGAGKNKPKVEIIDHSTSGGGTIG